MGGGGTPACAFARRALEASGTSAEARQPSRGLRRRHHDVRSLTALPQKTMHGDKWTTTHIHFVRELLFDAQFCAWPAGDHQSPRPCSCTQASHHSGSPKGNAQHLTTTAKSHRHSAAFCGWLLRKASRTGNQPSSDAEMDEAAGHPTVALQPVVLWTFAPASYSMARGDTEGGNLANPRNQAARRLMESGNYLNMKGTVEERA